MVGTKPIVRLLSLKARTASCICFAVVMVSMKRCLSAHRPLALRDRFQRRLCLARQVVAFCGRGEQPRFDVPLERAYRRSNGARDISILPHEFWLIAE